MVFECKLLILASGPGAGQVDLAESGGHCAPLDTFKRPSSKIISFIWGIADDVLRDLFKREFKYPDVILLMRVIRRMGAVLEPTKRDVLDAKENAGRGGHH